MKTKNYLGKHDENRGIIIFFIIFVVVLLVFAIISFANKENKDKSEKGISSIDAMSNIIEETTCDINTFKVEDNMLIVDGSVNDSIPDYIIRNLENIQLVLKSKDGDKYAYNLDYLVSIDKVEFSLLEDNKIQLDLLGNGEYFVFLRVKYTSNQSDTGYNYRYYTLKNNTDVSKLNYNSTDIEFKSSDKVDTYLTIVAN